MAQPRKPRPGTAPKRAPHEVAQPKQIALLASPARQELIDTLEAMGGEASVAELAAQLGRPADGLYYHLRLLQRGGLLEEIADSGDGRRYRTHAASGERLRLRYHGGRNAAAGAVQKVGASMLRIAARDFGAALQRPDVVTEGLLRELWASRSKGWVSEGDLTTINRLLQQVLARLHQPRSAERDRLISLTWVLAPLSAKPARRGDTE